jgi:hypothetical protein
MESGFDAMGKPIPAFRKEAAYQQAKEMGVDSADDRMSLVNSVSEHLERDHPYEAQAAAMQYLDLTGAYRLMAVLLTGEAKTEATCATA